MKTKNIINESELIFVKGKGEIYKLFINYPAGILKQIGEITKKCNMNADIVWQFKGINKTMEAWFEIHELGIIKEFLEELNKK